MDGLRSGISVNVDFVSGEIPSPAKLSAITAQLRRGLSQVEQAIGDIHSESYPYTSASTTTLSQAWGKDITDGTDLVGTAERKLDIANLARLIGSASNLNPKTISGVRPVREDVPVGVHEFALKYPISGLLTAVTTTDPALVTYVADIANMFEEGDGTWNVTRGGKVRCTTPTEGGTITYDMDPLEFAGGMNYSGATFNVIPDPNQTANGVGLTIGSLDGSGRRLVTLPLITHQQSNDAIDDIALSDVDANHNEQLKLPRVLNLNLSAGDEIPAGFLFLRNDTTGEVYEDAIYYWNDPDSIHVANVDLVDALASSNIFSLITVGTDITTSIDDLRNKTRHNHDRSLGESYVNVLGIVGQYEEPGITGPYTKSDMPGNTFAQYLHRDGYHGAFDENINDSNAMRGHILFGMVGSIAGNYTSDLGIGESFGIAFGGTDDLHARIYKTADGFLNLHSGDNSVLIELNQIVSPNTDTSRALVVRNGPIKAEEGFRFPSGTEQGTNVGIFAVQGSVPNPGLVDTHFVPIGASLADIEQKFWLSVNLTLKADGVEQFYGPDREAAESGDHFWSYYFDRSGGISRIMFFVTGPEFPAGNISFSLVIHYIP